MSRLQELRSQIDDFIAHHPQSPLTGDQRATFTGLNYYDENDSLAFTTAVQRFSDSEPLMEMETNTGDRRLYRRWGRFVFTVGGEEAALTIYSDPHGQDFFLPFRDATSGKETYGAGRYMDNHRPALQQLSENQVRVDFNYAYNPYCAYNMNYSCPLPPRENWLNVPVRAGEKKFEG
jgi:uncharacterized protein (DUF1684 family)